MVQNPQSLLDEFALVVPGQVTAPSQVTVLFDAPGVAPHSIGPNVSTPQSVASAAGSNPLNPTTIVLALATVGMLLIALVSVGGFTVLAQRRLRSLGMLGALGATDRNIRLVVRINGVLVGVTGAVLGLVLGLAAWLAYRPIVEADAHHVIGPFQLPWVVIGPAMALAVLATYFAASRPARAITRIPVVTALAGRPAPPKQVHRTALPGLIVLAVAVVLFAYTGRRQRQRRRLGPGARARLRRADRGGDPARPVLPDRAGPGRPPGPDRGPAGPARPGPVPGPVRLGAGRHHLGILIAVMVVVLAAAAVRQRARLGRAQRGVQPAHRVHAERPGRRRAGQRTRPAGRSTAPRSRGGRTAHAIAAALGAHEVVPLIQPNASLDHAASGRQWTGTIYLATPQLLHAFGIPASQVDPNADVLTMRPGLSGLGKMQLTYLPATAGGGSKQVGPGGPGGPGGQQSFPCPKGSCLANPVIQEISALPSGTSAPNTVFTEHAVRTLHLTGTGSPVGWLIQTPNPPTAAQITNARHDRRGRWDVHRDQEQHPDVGEHHQLGHRVRHRRWRWASWPCRSA